MKLKALLLTCTTLTLIPLLVQAAEPPTTFVQSQIQAPMPEWYREGFSRGHLNIPLMMRQGYTRFEAIEIQNQMKDILEADPEYMKLEYKGLADELFQDPDPIVIKALETAIDRVKNKKIYESGFQPRPLQDHEFYVAFDMDETLLTQWYKMGEQGAKYQDLKGLYPDSILRPDLKGPAYVSMTPGWEKAMLDLVNTPGCQGILIFTAKEDRAAHDIIDHLRIQNQPLRKFLAGVFTRNHLVRDNKSVKPSKDLRIIDESLKHIVLIDDNPTRIFPKQQANLREFTKYNPDGYFAAQAKKEHALTKIVENYLPIVVSEIQDAANYSHQHKISFKDAFYPYSMAGSAEFIMLLKQGYNMPDAIQFLREEQRKIFEPKFYIPEQK